MMSLENARTGSAGSRLGGDGSSRRPAGGAWSSRRCGVRSQITLGRVFGVKIGLHYSWFLIALLIVLSLSSQFHLSNPEWGDHVILTVAIVTAILFFVSLLLHELAHSLVAIAHGLP